MKAMIQSASGSLVAGPTIGGDIRDATDRGPTPCIVSTAPRHWLALGRSHTPMSTDLGTPPPRSGQDSLPRPARRAASRRKRRSKRWVALVAVLVVLVPTVDSYGRALTGPGNDALSIRSIEW